MEERIAQISSEEANVTPEQQSFLIKNASNLHLPTSNYIGDTNKVNKELANQLASNERFLESLNNPDSPYNKSFMSIKDLLADRNYAPLMEKYGDDYEKREGGWMLRAMYEESSMFGKARSNFNYAKSGLELSALYHKLDLARESGDAQAIEEAMAEIQKQQEIVESYFPASTMAGRGAASLAASVADNPWSTIAGVGASIATAGAGAPAWLATLAGGVARVAAQTPRSYELMAGEAYQTLSQEHPDATQAELHKWAKEAGTLNTWVENLPDLAAFGFAVGKVARAGVRSAKALKLKPGLMKNADFTKQFADNISVSIPGAEARTVQRIANMRDNKMLQAWTRAVKASRLKPGLIDNPEFKKQFEYQARKNLLGSAGKFITEHFADASIESIQEVFQDIITGAASSVALGKSESIGEAAMMDLGQFLADPFSPENADKMETLASTFLGSLIFTTGSQAGISALGSGSKMLSKKTKSVGDAVKDTTESRNWFQHLFNWRQTSNAGKENSPANRAHLMQMIKNGQTPGDKVYIDEAKAQELLKTLDENVVRLLKLDEAIKNKDANGGLIAINLADYDEVVSTNGELFQQIRDNISIDPTVFSTQALMDRFLAGEKNGAELAAARADKNSVFNKVLDVMSRNKNQSRAEREFSAMLSQVIINRLSEATGLSKEEIFDKLVISLGRSNPREAMLSPEEIKAEQEKTKEIKRRIRITDANTLGQILSDKGFAVRGLSGRAIRELANMNVQAFTLEDALATKSKGQTIRESLSKIEQNKESGDKILLDAGWSQEQIDALNDADWTRAVKGELDRQGQEMGITAEDSLIDDDQLQALEEWDDSLFQETEGKIAGRFKKEGEKYLVRLEKISNPTTFSHEMFHFFHTVLMEKYNEGKLSEYWKERVESLTEFIGGTIQDGKIGFPDIKQNKAKGDQVLLNAGWKQEKINKLTPEQWTQAVQTQVMENGADAFTNYIRQGKVPNSELTPIMALMKHLFARVYRALGLRKVKLNKKIRGVFDSIFMAQRDIEQLQRNQGLLAVEKPMGADNDLYDDYQKNVLTSRARASEKYVRDLKAYQEDMNSDATKKEIEARKNQIIGRMSTEPFYQAQQRYKELIASGLTEEQAMSSLQTEFAEELTLEDIQRSISFDAEGVAQTQAEQEVSNEVKAKYDLLDESLAEKSFKNTDKAKALLQEYVLLTGGTMEDFQRLWVEINEKVDEDIAGMDMKKVNDKEFWMDAEAMAVERYAIAKQLGKTQEAAEQRRTQAIITLVRMKTEAIKNRFQKFTAHARTMSGQQKTNVMDAMSYDLLQSILKAFKFPVLSRRILSTPLMNKLTSWLDGANDKYLVDFSSLKPLFPEVAEGLNGTVGTMTVNQFEKLETVFNAIDKFARSMWNEKMAVDEQTKQSLLQQIADRMREKKIITGDTGWWGKILWSFTNPEPMIRKLLPQSVVDKFFTPLMNASSLTEVKMKELNQRADKALSKINYSNKKNTFAGVEITYKDMADLLVSMGNEHAYDNMVLKIAKQIGRELTRTEAEAMAADALKQNPQYAEFMNEIWGIYESVLPDLNTSYMETFNRVFIQKEPRTFNINGIEFKGGYVPENKHTSSIVYDQSFISNTMGEGKNEKLIVKEADGDMKSVVENISAHIFMFSKMAYMRVAYNNAASFFESDEFRNIVGENPYKFISDWLKNLKNPSKTDSKAMSLLAGMSNAAALGWNIGRVAVQLTGIIPAMTQFKGWNKLSVFAEIPNMLRAVANGTLISELKGKSAYMNARYENPREAILGLKGSSAKKLSSFQQLAVMPLTWGDAMASHLVWNAKYKESISQGRTEEQAVADADAAVRLTQSDSMTASRAKFLQSEWSRMFTPFMSYIMSMQSMVRGSLMSREYWEAARVAACYMVFAPFFESMIKEATSGPDDDDDDKFWMRVSKRYATDVTTTIGTSAFPVANFGGSLLTAIGAGIDKAADGELDVYKTYQMSAPILSYLDNFNRVLEATTLYVGGYDQDKAREKIITGTSGIVFGTEGKRWAKRFLASD